MKRFQTGHWRPSRREAMAAFAGLAACSAGSEQPQPAPPVKQAVKAHPLWPVEGPPVLRGACIAQRRRVQSVDGPTFGGGGPTVPAYGAREFDALAEAGANLVVMSFPGIWSIAAPYRADAAMIDLLGRQLDQAQRAGLYAVVGFRSGPGRSDFIFHRDSAGDWFPKELIVDSIWRNREAQAAWADMCVEGAKLIASRSEIAGLILMVEPEPNFTGLDHDGRQLGVWEPAEYARRVGEISDWRRIASDCAKATRAADASLPILISPPAFARPDFLPVMGEPPVPGVVWCVHDYEPRDFTHMPQTSAGLIPFQERRGEFEQRMTAAKQQGAPVFLGEFGVARWQDDAGKYLAARASACEALGVNWAAFRWPTFNAAYEEADNMFNVVKGPDRPLGAGDIATITALREAWMRNTARP